MKKVLIFLLLLSCTLVYSQKDSSQIVYVKGKRLDTTLTYITVNFEVFSTLKKSESYWMTAWKGLDDKPIAPKSYGLDMKKVWDDMIQTAKDYAIVNYKGKSMGITNEDDLFNVMAANGYRFILKTPIPPINVGLVAARAFAGTSYKFERR